MSMVDKVRQFHEKNGVSLPVELRPPSWELCQLLTNTANLLHYESTRCDLSDPVQLRAHLKLEETAEWFQALADGDEVALLDAIADLQYILAGDCVTFGLPLEEAFEEVHRSNMSKERQPDDSEGERVRDKGPNYSPPDLKGVLEKHRGMRMDT